MKFLVLLIIFIIGCATVQPQNTMLECRKLCKSGVAEYVDDSINCICFNRKEKTQ